MRLFGQVTIALMLLSVSSQADKKLEMGFIEFAPYYFTAKNGEPAGYFIDMATSLAERTGHKLTFRSYPAKRLALSVVAGKTDIFMGMSTLADFSDGVMVSSLKLDTIQLRAYSTKPMPPVASVKDLEGKNVLLIRGYSYGDWFEEIEKNDKINYYLASTHAEALNMLKFRPIDYLLDYKLPVEYALKEAPLPQLYYNDVFTLNPTIMVSEQHPQAAEVMRSFEEAYLTLFPQGLSHLKKPYQSDTGMLANALD